MLLGGSMFRVLSITNFEFEFITKYACNNVDDEKFERLFRCMISKYSMDETEVLIIRFMKIKRLK